MGKERITCDLPKEECQALNDYYSGMTSVDVGDRLYERTMCIAELKTAVLLKEVRRPNCMGYPLMAGIHFKPPPKAYMVGWSKPANKSTLMDA